MKLGAAFHLHTDTHIWVVAHESDAGIVIFNFSSWRSWNDHSCVIKPAEYVELKHDSIIVYEGGELVEGDSIQSLEQHGIRDVVQSVSEQVLAKIALGAKRSEQIPGKLKKLF